MKKVVIVPKWANDAYFNRTKMEKLIENVRTEIEKNEPEYSLSDKKDSTPVVVSKKMP